jgi:tetratricopeptide (TPR) repeat protein
VDFAARKIEEAKVIHEVELMKLEKPFCALTPQAQAEVLRTRVYFHFACMQMEACIEPALAALAIYKKGKFVFAQENYQRMQLRLAEVYYLRSYFTEALSMFREAFKAEDTVPDRRGYYNTKYIQLCLIQGEVEEAKHPFDS